MALHEKQQPFTQIEEKLSDKSPALLRLHPEAKVPVMVHGELVLYESVIMTQYIDEQFSGPALMPASPDAKAQVRLLSYWCNSQFKPHIDAYKYGTHRKSAEEVAEAPAKLNQDLQKLSKQLSDKPFLFGENISLADIHIFPFFRQLTKATPYFEKIDTFDNLKAWLQRICDRPSFEKTMRKQHE